MRWPLMSFTYPKPFELSECNGRDIWAVSSSSTASWLNACVGRSEWSLHLSPEQSLASIRAASGGASATEWEQNRPDCVRREALARDQVHLKPPLILQCAVELLYSPNTTPNTCLARLLDWEHHYWRGPSKWWGTLLLSSSIEHGE